MDTEHNHATVIRMEDRYAVLALDSGDEKLALFSALPQGVKVGDRVCWHDNRWISERELRKKKNRQLRSLRSLLKGK